MARQIDFQKLTAIRALRTVSTSSSVAAGSSVSGSGRTAGAGGGAPPADDGATTRLLNRLRNDGRVVSLLHSYEDVVGIGDVKRAQKRVTQIEQQFIEIREAVKKSAQSLHNVQAELRAIRSKLDRTSRSDTKFLEYATEEHEVIQKEREMDEGHTLLVDAERNTFQKLSAAVRESHERQQSQKERTKYWGVIGSVVGTVIGLLGSTAINQKRMRELRAMVGDLQKDIGQNGQLRDLQGLVVDIRNAIDNSSSAKSNQEELTAALERLSKQQQEGLDSQEKSLTKILKHQEGLLLKEMEGVRKFAAVGAGDMTTLEEMVNHAEQKLEWGMKMSTLSTVVFIYGAFALTLPILYSIFK